MKDLYHFGKYIDRFLKNCISQPQCASKQKRMTPCHNWCNVKKKKKKNFSDADFFLICVTNPVYELPFTHHQRSLAHHIDSCTTLLLHFTIELQFPSSIALTTHSCHQSHIALITQLITHFISLGLPLCHCRVLYSVYHSPSDSYSTEPTQLL